MNKNKKISRFLPYSKQLIDKKDIKAVSNVLRENFITQGPRIALFEKNFARYVGAKFAVAVTSNTIGLDLVLKAYNIKN